MSSPRECECHDGMPWFDINAEADADNAIYWLCVAKCTDWDICGRRVEATGPTPQAALDAAIEKWNKEPTS